MIAFVGGVAQAWGGSELSEIHVFSDIEKITHAMERLCLSGEDYGVLCKRAAAVLCANWAKVELVAAHLLTAERLNRRQMIDLMRAAA
jgi:hypothetical protein